MACWIAHWSYNQESLARFPSWAPHFSRARFGLRNIYSSLFYTGNAHYGTSCNKPLNYCMMQSMYEKMSLYSVDGVECRVWRKGY